MAFNTSYRYGHKESKLAAGIRNCLFFQRLIFTFFFLLQFHPNCFSEGTDKVRPGTTDEAYIQLIARNGSGKRFAYYNGEVDYRLNIHICSPGEIVNLGFSKVRNTGNNSEAAVNQNITFRIKDPSGAIVFGPQAIQKSADSLHGQIFTYQQAIAGPTTIAPAIGYDPFKFIATAEGDYYIEFTATNNNSDLGFLLFDITVTDASNRRRDGRLWSKAWMLNTGNFANPYNGDFYILSNDNIVTQMDLNGTQPYEFIFSANNTGTTNTGNAARDRMSVYNDNKTYPLYKIFLNDPDSSCFKNGILGEITGTPTLTGCAPNYCINFSVTADGQVQAFLDLNGTLGYQSGTRDVLLQKTAVAGENCLPWDGRDGLGNTVAANNNIPINLLYVNGLTHLPIFDVENNTKGYMVSYVRPLPTVQDPIKLYWDDSNIRPSSGPQGNSNAIAGCTGACHTWRFTVGDNNRPDYGNLNTINTWWYINPSSKYIEAKITNLDIDANRNTLGKGKDNDTSICASAKEIGLFGSIVGGKSVKWSTLIGSGIVAGDTMLTTRYAFSAIDTTRSSVVLLLSAQNGTCNVAHDTITVHINPNPQISLTAPPPSCGNTKSVVASASFSGTKGVWWQGEGGEFTDSLKANIQYVPTDLEIERGKVVLTATTLPNLPQFCSIKSSRVEIVLKGKPTLKLPTDTSLCQNSSLVLTANSIPNAIYYWGNSTPNPSNSVTLNLTSSLLNYKVVVKDVNGCKDSSYLNIHVVPYPEFQLSGDNICVGQTKYLQTRLIQPSLSSQYTILHQWKRNGAIFANSEWRTLTYTEPAVFELELNIDGCKVQHPIYITNSGTLKLDIERNYKACFESEPPITLKSSPAEHYAWYDENGTLIGTTQSIKVSPEKDTRYGLKITDNGGCKDSVPLLVRVVCPPRLFVPNVVTPESQDVNSRLHIYGAHYTNFEITIFSRWGEVIYNTKDPKNVWDGVYKSENMPIGVYPWIVTYEGDSEEYKGPYKKVGDVTVVR